MLADYFECLKEEWGELGKAFTPWQTPCLLGGLIVGAALLYGGFVLLTWFQERDRD